MKHALTQIQYRFAVIYETPSTLYAGVTFLIAYVTMLLVAGLPLFFLELTIGQYAGKGPIKMFGRMAPAMKVSIIFMVM